MNLKSWYHLRELNECIAAFNILLELGQYFFSSSVTASILLLSSVDGCFAHTCVCTTCTHKPMRSEEGIRPSGAGVTDGFKAPCGCWESSPGPLEERSQCS